MMDVGRLQKFEGKITAQGKLILHGPLQCTECPSNAVGNTNATPKPRDLQVFLFEQNIIFSEIVGKKTQFTSPSYIYKSHVQVRVGWTPGGPADAMCLLYAPMIYINPLAYRSTK